ncbi:MAG: transposase [Victivallaceae bacterium]|nr:transposase [Victivallaceae bacterium]
MSKKRKFQTGRTYHITHRCHHRSYFLKFEIDRDKYIRLLWEGSRKFNVDIFNFIITSNHVHLLLASDLEEKLRNAG